MSGRSFFRLFSILIIGVFLMSCQPDEKENAFNGYTYQTGELNIISKVILGEDEIFDPSSAALSFKKCGDLYAFMSRGGVVRLYDAEGERQFLFDKNQLDNGYEFPSGLPIAFDFDAEKEMLYVLFGGSKTLYGVNHKGIIVKTIDLKMPKNIFPAMAPHLAIDFEEEEVFLTTGDANADVVDNTFFKKSSLLSRFTLDGQFKNHIGKYPVAYHDSGKFSRGHPFRFYRYLKKGQRHYFLFDISPEVFEYHSNGELLTTHKVPGSVRNYRFEPSGISHFSDEQPQSPTNDVHHFLAKRADEYKFYVGSQLLREEHHSKDTYLIQADIDEKVVKEVNLTEIFGVAFHARLASVISSDTLDFFLASPFSDRVGVVRATIK